MSEAVTFVVGDRTFRVRAARDDAPRSMTVTVVMDGRYEWTFDEPGWRPLSIGAVRDRGYLWSARGLIVLPRSSDEGPELIRLDEDLLFVFCVDAGWVLVCETSVRRMVAGNETANLQFGEVLERARWESGTLVVGETSGLSHRIVISGREAVVVRRVRSPGGPPPGSGEPGPQWASTC